ncbi:DEAD/DEAH box helicase family protein, partial [Paraprevotella xylaniphila]|uniref:DEAD/DEAH box helicase family protein n=1 Tax=Paraprevotella xylaniphila TaxID=454155 RepID=UPI003FD714C5
LYIPLNSISEKVANHLKRIAAFKNPEFYSKQAMRISTYNIPRIICRADFTDDYLALPRGCEDAVTTMLESLGVAYEMIDETNHGKPVAVAFKGKERDEQLDAINSLMPYTNGILAATTAFGKTVTAAALIARKKVSTLVLVHSKALLLQWHERLTDFLEIEFAEPATSRKRGRKKVFSPIGCLDSTSNTLHGVIDIALMQSCFENGEVRPFVREYGMVIVDECHHVSSITFENVLRHITAHHVYGLTATPIRKDGLQPIIFMQCGPIRFSADAKTQIQKQSFQRYLVPRFTSYRSVTDNRQSFALLSQSLAESELRNTLIVEDVLNAVTAGRTPIILTGRTSHVKLLSEMLKPHIANVIQLTGEGTAKSKREVLQGLHDIPQNSPLVIVATGKYVGEGFDYPRLDTLFLALPISWKGLVAQYAGRLHRENEEKADVRIYDYIDIHEPVCESMYRKRLKGYSAIGYRVLSKDCQTLFDATEGLQSSPHEEQIFNGITFCHPFIKELKASRQSIVISSPKLYHMERNKFVNILKELQRDGIEVAILTLTENGQSDYLRRQGLFVKIVPELSLCSCIMDKSSVWYGSINILGYPTEEDNIIRIKDIRLAEEFLDVIYNNGNGK